MKTLFSLLALGASFVFACSSGPTAVSGSADDAGAVGKDGGDATAPAKTPLGGAAQASAFLGKCKVACQPPDGPCAGGDVNACINDCTAVVEGLPVPCAQCITEHSGWDGKRCGSTGALCAFTRSGPPLCRSFPCEDVANCPKPTCAAAEETCDGYSFAKASYECKAECQ